jgi:hypothetical protein
VAAQAGDLIVVAMRILVTVRGANILDFRRSRIASAKALAAAVWKKSWRRH